jgi:hypothetical protein
MWSMETNKELIAVKVHETDEGIVIGACDLDLLGKTFKEDDITLELVEEFYSDKQLTIEELLEIIESSITANLVGKKLISAYCEENPNFESSVKTVEGVPHLHVFRL